MSLILPYYPIADARMKKVIAVEPMSSASSWALANAIETESRERLALIHHHYCSCTVSTGDPSWG